MVEVIKLSEIRSVYMCACGREGGERGGKGRGYGEGGGREEGREE